MNGKWRYCLYKGEYLSAKKLSRLDECAVSLPTLIQRISQGVNNSDRSGWDTIEKCLTVKTLSGRPGTKRLLPKLPLISGEFIRIMMSMPVYDYKPRIIQGKPL